MNIKFKFKLSLMDKIHNFYEELLLFLYIIRVKNKIYRKYVIINIDQQTYLFFKCIFVQIFLSDSNQKRIVHRTRMFFPFSLNGFSRYLRFEIDNNVYYFTKTKLYNEMYNIIYFII